jgi:uncharacterized protein (TIGR02444 family)
MDFNEHPLWKFALAVYGAPGVAAACLGLQERRGADVNLVLYAAFVGASGRGRLDEAELARCRAAVRPWSELVVTRLRQVRRALKQDIGAVGAAEAAGLRQRLAALEIDAEQLEQRALAARLGPVDPARPAAERTADAEANVSLYLNTLPGGDPVADAAALATLTGISLGRFVADS